jgi:hypothetical protein
MKYRISLLYETPFEKSIVSYYPSIVKKKT